MTKIVARSQKFGYGQIQHLANECSNIIRYAYHYVNVLISLILIRHLSKGGQNTEMTLNELQIFLIKSISKKTTDMFTRFQMTTLVCKKGRSSRDCETFSFIEQAQVNSLK